MIGLTEFKPVLNNETATKEAVLLYLRPLLSISNCIKQIPGTYPYGVVFVVQNRIAFTEIWVMKTEQLVA